MPSLKRLSIRNGAFKVRCWSHGTGRPLIFLHGWSGMPRDTRWLEALAQRRLVIAPEFPGFGGSEGLEHLDDFLDIALYHFDLFAALKVKQADVMGHDFGGAIAAEVAALRPTLVRRLVLIAPTGLFDEKNPGVDPFATTEAELHAASWHDAEAAKRSGHIPAPQTDEEKKAAIIERAKAMAAAGKFLFPIPDKGLKKRLSRIEAPALLIWGAGDKMAPPSYAALFERQVKGARSIAIAKAGHFPMLEQPAKFTTAVTRFLG
jgi:pimeloyl-ACP methyl ester carboxylesterase